MKNSFILLFSLFLLSVTMAFADNVPVPTAQRAAQSFLNSKMDSAPEIHLIDFAEEAELPNFYVFGNEQCFVIVAADDCVHPVLGYSTENAFVTERMPESTFDWLKVYDEQISFARNRGVEAPSEVRSEWNRLLNGETLEMKSRSRVEPLVRTRWQYGTPFNNLCPSDTAGPGGHARAGCGAVAMAQLMNYWEHPVRGTGSFHYTPNGHPEYGEQYANFGETVYDWDNMRNVYQKTYSDAEAMAVATLIYHCGVSVQMNYGPDASGTSTSRLDDALIEYFGYNNSMSYVDKDQGNYSDEVWKTMLKNDLNAARPVIYRGQSQDNNVGHIFVCDGYDESDYFHFNWGYAGRWDGYYAIGALYGGANYSYVNRAIFGIFPNSTSINPPTNVSTSVDGRNVVVTWSPVSNASSYKVYRDGDLIANNINGTSFTNTNAPYGVHSFYVKSVKSDGTMSLKSNTSVADVHFSGPIPTNLQASVSGKNVNLSWNAPQPESAILQYGTGDCVAGVGGIGNGFYWAHRYPTTIMSDYAGMAVQKVAFYFKKPGSYIVSIYKGDEANPRELVQQQLYQASSTEGWQDVVFSSPVPIDYTQDLWVVFYADNNITHPASFCEFSGSGVIDAALYSSVEGGTIWKEYLYNGNTTSWLMKTYITDGTYTYNLYRNNNIVANNLTGNTYTDANLPDGFYDYHVTTNYYGGESDPSNAVQVQIGDAVTQSIHFANGWNRFSTYIEADDPVAMLDMLKASLGENGLLIESADYSTEFDGEEWFGDLDDEGITNEQTYFILVNNDCTVELTGRLADPADHPITLTPGWNRIGFPCTEEVEIAVALADLEAEVEDVLESPDGYINYDGDEWFGDIDTMIPGQGYLYYSNSEETKTFVFNTGAKKVRSGKPVFWNVSVQAPTRQGCYK